MGLLCVFMCLITGCSPSLARICHRVPSTVHTMYLIGALQTRYGVRIQSKGHWLISFPISEKNHYGLNNPFKT